MTDTEIQDLRAEIKSASPIEFIIMARKYMPKLLDEIAEREAEITDLSVQIKNERERQKVLLYIIDRWELRCDAQKSIIADLRTQLAAAENRAEAAVEDIVDHIIESADGIRNAIDCYDRDLLECIIKSWRGDHGAEEE